MAIHKKKKKKVKKFATPEKSNHHLIPRSRDGARVPNCEILIKHKKHYAWHQIFGNLTLSEIVKLLQNLRRNPFPKYYWYEIFGNLTLRKAVKLLTRVKEMRGL